MTPTNTKSGEKEAEGVGHSPLPWKVGDRQRGLVTDSNSQFVFKCFVGENRDRDAAFIVRAVNYHEEMLAALKGLCDELDKDTPDNWRAVRLAALDALAKAQGQQP